MLKDSLHARLLIRLSILFLRAIAPLSIVYDCVRVLLLFIVVPPVRWLWLVDAVAAIEAFFYLIFYLLRKKHLNRQVTPFNPLSSAEQRKEAFRKTWDSVYHVRLYVSQWFYGAPIEKIGREDMKDFISWRLWNETTRHPEDEAELEEHLRHVEHVLDFEFSGTRTGVSSMMVTFEPLNMKHRPLLWYACIIAGVDFQCWITMKWLGFDHHRLSLSRQLFGTIPFRPWTLLSFAQSPSSRISYWHFPHTAKSQLPVVFIHGIGVGLHFYLPFFKQMLAQNPGIGILAIELLHVSNRITFSPPPPAEIAHDVLRMINFHNIDRCVLLTHSYGSVIAAHLLRNPCSKSVISHLIFADPVAFSFHRPDVPYNFLRRKPTTASEIQLEYFASTDPDVARTLTRGFNWSENSLWRDDVERRSFDGRELKTTVMLAGKDIITDTVTLGRYLTRQENKQMVWHRQPQATDDDDAWMQHEWNGVDSLEVLWRSELNHAEIFEDEASRSMLVRILGTYARGHSYLGAD